MIELLQSHQEVARASCEPVELPDQDTVELTVASCGHQRVELGSTLSAPGHGDITVVTDNLQAGTLGVAPQPVILQVWLLVGGGNADIECGARSALLHEGLLSR